MNNKKKNIPALRFPEFVKEGEWEEKLLEEVAKNLDSKRIPITANQRQKGNIPYYGASGIIDFVNEYIFNDNLLCISEDGANLVDRNYPIAFSITGKAWVNNHAHVLKFHNKSTQILVENYINSVNVEDFLTGAAQPKLNRAKLDKIPLILPKNIIEQQKIASCLSSLDELISASVEKLALLKAHKKGLMQQLFPQAGEKVPQLRFPEFVGDGEWEEKNFENLFEIGNGKDYKHLDKGIIPVYGSGGYMLSINDYLYDGESVCIGRKGTIDKPMFITGKFWTVDTLFYTHSFKNCLPKFIFYIFQNIDWLKHNEAGGVPSLSKTNIYCIKVLIPSTTEQQKIASFLSSLDDLIQAQTEQVAALKAHKKGLMQGLFP